MSLIIAYVGKKGCVMASDKRKIGYFGDKKNLSKLEEELYEGHIDNDDDFLKRAKELGISIKITDDANKLKIIGNTIRGEVSTKGTFETRRRRIYGTKNGYQIVELLGSETESRTLHGRLSARRHARALYGIRRRRSRRHACADDDLSAPRRSCDSFQYFQHGNSEGRTETSGTVRRPASPRLRLERPMEQPHPPGTGQLSDSGCGQ